MTLWRLRRLPEKALSVAGSLIRPATTHALRYRPFQKCLNYSYESGGRVTRAVIDVSFSGPPPGICLLWHTTVLGKQFSVRINGTVPRSWNAALAWGWSGNRLVRHLYERIIETSPPGLFCDIGANDGVHTYPFAASGWRVLAVEPQPSCAAYVRDNCQLNAFANVAVQEVALGETEEREVELFVSKSTWFSSRERSNTERFETAESVIVRSTTLDRVLADLNLGVPTLIKIDVEGWEAQVLAGARSTLSHRPDILVEMTANNPRAPEVWRTTAELGLLCARLQHGVGFRPIASLASFLSEIAPPASDFLFATPDRLARLTGLGRTREQL